MFENARGNKVEREFFSYRETYFYDAIRCPFDDGWERYETAQDSWYFGVWVNREQRLIMMFAEGDEILWTCPTRESFDAEMAELDGGKQ